MKAKASVIAQKLLNLYRQAHVINGGWAAVNKIFIDEATDEVIEELRDLPTGKFLAQHIKNLRDGKTPVDSIARELLPYGGMLAESGGTIELEADNLHELIAAIDAFKPSRNGLDEFMNHGVIRDMGPDWILFGQRALQNHPEKLKRFNDIVQTWNAYRVWNMANDALNQNPNDRLRAQVQIDMPEYETYLPRFGDNGQEVLRRLHELTSSLPTKAA